MNESIRDTMNGFDGVWRRVTGGRAEAARSNCQPSDESVLREFIRNEQCAAQLDTCLARMLRGGARAMLLNHAAQASCRARQLQAEYFLMTGDRCVRRERCDLAECTLDALRDAYERGTEASDAYEEAAERTDSCELRELYERFACETCAAAKAVRSLIVSCF